MFKELTNLFSRTRKNESDFELEEINKAYKGVYLGGGEKNGEHSFFHLLFDDTQVAQKFSNRLCKNNLVRKAPNVIIASADHPNYPAETIYIRIHKSAFDNCKELIPKLPAQFEQLSPYKQHSKTI